MWRAPVQGTDRAKGGFGITASYPVPAGRCRDEECQEQLLSPPKQLVLSVACAVPFASRHAAGKSARPHQSLGSYRTPQLSREVFMHIHELTVNECREVLKNTNIGRLACARDNQPYVVPVHFYLDSIASPPLDRRSHGRGKTRRCVSRPMRLWTDFIGKRLSCLAA
jgi:hypothetical protein